MLLVEEPVIKKERVKVKPCLALIPNKHLDDRMVSLGNLTLHNDLYLGDKNHTIYNQPENCCQCIYANYYRFVDSNTQVLDYTYHNGIKYLFEDSYARMTIVLSDFINPLKDYYTDIKYITMYIDLLKEMDSPWFIEEQNKNVVVLRMNNSFYNKNEKSLLTFHWQAVRNLILNYTLHVPARFIELVNLYRKDFDILFLYQAAYRMIPVKCLFSQKGQYTVNNYVPFLHIIKFSPTVFGVDTITFNRINRTLKASNLRSKIVKSNSSKHFFLNYDVVYTNDKNITFTIKEYEKLYKELTTKQSKESLYLKLRLLKANKLHEN
jgi:hypothetical protein